MNSFFSFRSFPRPIFLFFFNDTATTEIYTLSLHDALPICLASLDRQRLGVACFFKAIPADRSEEPSELQSRQYLVCRLLLDKKKKKKKKQHEKKKKKKTTKKKIKKKKKK